MTTARKETRLQIIPEKLSLRPNSQDLCYVNIDLVGTDGVTKSTEGRSENLTTRKGSQFASVNLKGDITTMKSTVKSSRTSAAAAPM